MINKRELISISQTKGGSYNISLKDNKGYIVNHENVLEKDGYLYFYDDYKEIECFVKKEVVEADIASWIKMEDGSWVDVSRDKGEKSWIKGLPHFKDDLLNN